MNTWFVNQQEYKGRLKICKGCDQLNPLWQCKTCLCFMPAKARFTVSYCPLHKWGKGTTQSADDPNPNKERINLDDGEPPKT